MNIEVPFVPGIAEVKNASASFGESPKAGTPYIISNGSTLEVDFKWTQDGDLWKVLAGNWKVSCVFEAIGGAETNYNPSTTVSHVAAKTHSYNATVTAPNLPPDTIYRVFAQIHFEINGVMLVCGFQEVVTVMVK